MRLSTFCGLHRDTEQLELENHNGQNRQDMETRRIARTGQDWPVRTGQDYPTLHLSFYPLLEVNCLHAPCPPLTPHAPASIQKDIYLHTDNINMPAAAVGQTILPSTIPPLHPIINSIGWRNRSWLENRCNMTQQIQLFCYEHVVHFNIMRTYENR